MFGINYNLQVVHAVADAPDQPYSFTRKQVVMPVFAHEPTVSRVRHLAPASNHISC